MTGETDQNAALQAQVDDLQLQVAELRRALLCLGSLQAGGGANSGPSIAGYIAWHKRQLAPAPAPAPAPAKTGSPVGEASQPSAAGAAQPVPSSGAGSSPPAKPVPPLASQPSGQTSAPSTTPSPQTAVASPSMTASPQPSGQAAPLGASPPPPAATEPAPK
jgi:hypothetical protein